MKLLFIGDVHIADSPPSRRKESYKEEILTKLLEIVQIANSSNVDYVLFAGDIFHHKEPRKVSHRLVQEVINVFSEFDTKVLILVGNHDITHGQLSSLQKQPLGVVGSTPGVELLEWNAVDLGDGVFLHPIPGVHGVDSSVYKIKKPKNSKKNIIVAHQSIVPDKSLEKSILQTLPHIHNSYDVAKITDADLILYGHQHRQDGIYTRGEKIFINMGAICRGNMTGEEQSRHPTITLIEVTDKISYEPIKLKNVKPVEEVFYVEEYYEEKAHRADIDEAIKRLKSTAVKEFSLESVISDISNRSDVESQVKDKAVDLLEQVR